MPRTLQEIGPRDALLWLPFRDQYNDAAGKRVTKNYGLAPGAPATCQMGDGTTAGTFPAQIGGGKRGILSVNGGGVVGCSLLTGIANPFTVGTVQATLQSASPSQDNFFGNWGALGSGLLVYTPASTIISRLRDGAANIAATAPAPGGSVHSVITTYDGTGAAGSLLLYIDGKLAATSVYSGGVPSNTLGEVPLWFCGSVLRTIRTGVAFSAGVCFQSKLTPNQISSLHARLMRESNLP